ncbi:hypothetical protein FRB94_006190 [Tulasnella sp. JGI-2019a]|nr:hypothetical protein FRB93_006643 [Tulasnella sp. JGI-2019a]KAG8999410.1 hypothetical protein FRB94_006190 [Tulasnella sp. JGI-2019a]
MGSIWRKTPLLHSDTMSTRLGCDVYLKLENLQPPQSFKFRGISLFAQRALEKYGPSVHLIVASGGNAAYATSSAAKILNLRCTAYIPEASKPFTSLLEAMGTKVVVGGVNYFAALQAAQQAAEANNEAVLVPAYDHPTLWEGHSSMIDEIQDQLPSGVKPDAVLCSVGGGGLLGGVITGCDRVGWKDVPIVALETQGANCFYESMLANRTTESTKNASIAPASFTLDETYNVHIAHLNNVTSRAACLGATSPSAGIVRMALDRKSPVKCVCMSDQMSLTSAIKFSGQSQYQMSGLATHGLGGAFPLIFQTNTNSSLS